MTVFEEQVPTCVVRVATVGGSPLCNFEIPPSALWYSLARPIAAALGVKLRHLCVVANENERPNIIHWEDPVGARGETEICVVAVVVKKRSCANCGYASKYTRICSGCRMSSYCGPWCQSQHYGVHRAMCKFLRNAETGYQCSQVQVLPV